MDKGNYSIFLLFVMAATLVVAGCGRTSQTTSVQEPVEINVAAAMGLKEALLEIQHQFETENPQIRISYNLAASGVLEKQIQQGAPADVFISAAYQQINELEQHQLIKPETKQNLVRNELVVIVNQSSSLAISQFSDLASEQVKQVAIGNPETVPAGDYARQVLTKIKIWDEIQGKVNLAKDVKTIVGYVETGNVDAGIVFSALASTSKQVKVVATAPAGSHEPIVFPGVILRQSQHPQEAEKFLAYLTSPEAMEIFKKYGFSSVK